MPPVSTTPAANFVTSFTSVVDTGGKFVNDTGGKLFATGVIDTGGKFAAGIVDKIYPHDHIPLWRRDHQSSI